MKWSLGLTYSKSGKSLSHPWLVDYLDDAIERNLCVRICCTVCGALAFRRGIYDRAAREIGIRGSICQDFHYIAGLPSATIEKELIYQLSLLNPDATRSRVWFHPVRLIIYDIWWSIDRIAFYSELMPVLKETWAGSVLHAMEEHNYSRIQAELERHAQQEKKRMLKQKALEERALRKKDRDRIWFEKHPKREDSNIKIKQ